MQEKLTLYWAAVNNTDQQTNSKCDLQKYFNFLDDWKYF